MIIDKDSLLRLVRAKYKSEKWRGVYERYIGRLVERGVPPILSFRHLADSIEIAPSQLRSMAFATHLYYRSFEIPKRSGGSRQILAPYPSIDSVQRWIVEYILKAAYQEFDTCVTGYVNGRSIVDHVTPHASAECLVKFDLKDFFPSIRQSDVTEIFCELGFTLSVSRTLAALVTVNGSLPQGASTSPILSNIYLRQFDRDLKTYCSQFGARYTRYADDMVISGDTQLLEQLGSIKSFFTFSGLTLNHAKTRVYKTKSKVRFVTGLMIEDGKIRLPKAMRRRIRAQCHLFFIAIEQMVSGDGNWVADTSIKSWRDKEFLLDPTFGDRLVGKLNYWLHIEPTNSFAIEAKSRILNRLSII
ncbi:MAG: reverse transcriptase family protein [Burkholderiaceae bacterium]|nr:reverse transcriptase family protein [Burkholderiaceae bacterium]